MATVDPSPAAGGAAGGRYDFAVGPGTPYARAVTMLDRHAGPGLVVDLGCSFGRVAEVIAERQRTYVGIDLDDEALASLRARGHDTGRLDLNLAGDVARISDVVGDRGVGAVLALDVIEHLPDTAAFLDRLVGLLRRWGDPLLVTSIPNVAHRDLAAKLLGGRWDYTDVGLLDRTHVSFFTEGRMLADLGAHGLVCVDADDVVVFPAPDQQFPPLHPYLVESTPAARLISWLRALPDSRGDTYQFVRAWRRSPGAAPPPPVPAPTPALRVIIAPRSDHDALDGLEDTLVCLGAQDRDDFDVIVPVASEQLGAVETLVGSFAVSFAGRVHPRALPARTAAGRLNGVLGQVRAPLTAFVVAGDVVIATWVRHFVDAADAHPGAVLRARSFRRLVERSDGVTLSQTNAVAASDEHFDLWRHLSADQLPLGSFALPTALCDAGLRFDESTRAASWKFTFLAAMLAGVAEIPTITCVHQRLDGEQEPSAEELGAALEQTPVFLPPGWVPRLQGDRDHLAYLAGELPAARAQADAASRLYDQIRASPWWRASAPGRRGLALIRARRRARG
ncbi:MAG: class I SAM-dependent methyltransferase [Acidimicrobiales bacterium]